MFFFLLLFLCCLPATASLTHQSPSKSLLQFSEPTRIRVPPFVFVSGALESAHPWYLVQSAWIHKPTRKYHEYEYDAEQGIAIETEDGRTIRDTAPFPDFSAQYIGIASFSIFIAALFRLFG